MHQGMNLELLIKNILLKNGSTLIHEYVFFLNKSIYLKKTNVS